MQDFRIGIPGMLLQVFGGYAFIRNFIRNFFNTYIYLHINMTIFPLLIGGLGIQEVLLIALVVLLFFGGKKIPEMMNGLGKGVRAFKDGMSDMKKDIEEKAAEEESKKDEK